MTVKSPSSSRAAPSKAKEPPKEKPCELVRDLTTPTVRIVIKCEGEPDIVLLDLGAPPDQPVIHATGSSNASLA